MNYQKFIVFVISMLTVVALGVTLYYFMKDEEFINLQTSEINVNVGDKFTISYQHENPLDGTKIKWNIRNTNLVSFNEETNEFTALAGGETEIWLETNRNGWKVQQCVVRIGDGTNENPYMISTASQLYAGLENLSDEADIYSSYKLIADIDLSNSKEKFEPLFNGLKFAGDFDGNNHKIYNMSIISNDYLESAGLFYGIAHSGKVHDLVLDNIVISGNIANIGTVAGYNNGIIEKVKVNNATLSSTIESTVAQIGGISARVSAVKDIASVGSVNYINLGRIDRCQITNATLVGYKKSIVGGLVATLNGGSILNSAFNGTISTENSETITAGIVATMTANANQNAKLKDNYAVVSFSNVTNKAGIVYNNDYSQYKNSQDKIISENVIWGQYFDSEVCNDASVKAIVNNGYSDQTVFNKRVEDKILVANGVPSATLKSKTIFSHKKYKGNQAEKDYFFDFSVTWALNNEVNNGYPTLQMLGKTEDGFINVNGEIEVQPEDPIAPEETRTLHEILSQTSEQDVVALPNDIDWNGLAWTPIGTEENPFNATFDGRGHTVKNIVISSAQFNSAGIFGVLGENAVIKNITFENVVVTSGQYVGIVAGKNYGTITNVKVKTTSDNYKGINVTTNNSLSAGSVVGLNAGSIDKVASNIEITASTGSTTSEFRIGGIIGTNDGYLYDAESQVNINSNAQINRVGGVVGYNNSSVKYVAFKGAITASLDKTNTFVGGIAGYNMNPATLTLSSVDSTLKGYNVGGLVGYNTGKIEKNNVISTNLEGERLGGFVATMNRGTMYDCSAIATLKGISKDSIKGGFATYVDGSTGADSKGSYARVERCFVATTFEGEGTNYAETQSPIRKSLADTNAYKQAGFIINSVYDSTVADGAKTQGRSGVILGNDNSGRYDGNRYDNLDGRTKTDKCKNDLAPFTSDNRNFDYVNVWSLATGEYPLVREVKTF